MKIFAAISIAIAVFPAAAALADPVKDRRAAMDQVRFGAATLVPMLKGDAEFDALTAELALRMTYAGAIAFQGKFPEGATSKGANPAIWETHDDFLEKSADFQVGAANAVQNKPANLAELKAVYQPLLDDCAACHKSYRIKE